MATGCLFCQIVAGDIASRHVYDDAHTLAFHDVNPQAPTHVLVIPKRHFDNIGELAAADGALLAEIVAVGTTVAHDAGIATAGYRLVFNTGRHGGQTVDHVHLHVLGGREFGWPPG